MNTVLLVEDNPTLRESISFELEMRNYTMLQAEDGRAAIECLRSANPLPDIIVSDIAMPDMDGYALLEHARNNPEWQNIPFVFLTAFGSKNAIRIGQNLGVDDYLVKPFDADDLDAVIQNKINRFKQLRENTMSEMEDTRREFLKMISHELRTPLTSIYGSTEMLMKTLPNVPDNVTTQLFTLLRSGTKRMKVLIERIVSLVQVESGKLKEQYEANAEVDSLNEIAQRVLEAYVLQDDAKQVNFLRDPNKVTIKTIRPFMELVVNELVHNADRYSHEDNIITIEVSSSGGQACIAVKDQGFGIDETLMPRLQEDLADTSSSYLKGGGIGVGLVLVREIVRIHEGTLALTSEQGVGTTVTITLPAAS